MTLHEWVKSERQAGRHWTQGKLAERLGVHIVTLNKAMRGHVEARVGLVQKVYELTDGQVGLEDWPAKENAAPLEPDDTEGS